MLERSPPAPPGRRRPTATHTRPRPRRRPEQAALRGPARGTATKAHRTRRIRCGRSGESRGRVARDEHGDGAVARERPAGRRRDRPRGSARSVDRDGDDAIGVRRRARDRRRCTSASTPPWRPAPTRDVRAGEPEGEAALAGDGVGRGVREAARLGGLRVAALEHAPEVSVVDVDGRVGVAHDDAGAATASSPAREGARPRASARWHELVGAREAVDRDAGRRRRARRARGTASTCAGRDDVHARGAARGRRPRAASRASSAALAPPNAAESFSATRGASPPRRARAGCAGVSGSRAGATDGGRQHAAAQRVEAPRATRARPPRRACGRSAP